MARRQWFSIVQVLLGVAFLLAARAFLPLNDAQLEPLRWVDYVPPILASLFATVGLVMLLVGAKKIVSR
jgi:hypothetical protein